MDENLRAKLTFEAQKKSVGAAYVLWFFLGLLGAHRFYLGRRTSGAVQLLLCLSIVGIIPLAFWWLIDAFRIPDMAEDTNMELLEQIEHGYTAQRLEQHASDPAPVRSRDPRVEEIRAMSRR